MAELAGKVALVTGAGSGIGKAAGGEALALSADVADAEAMKAAVGQLVEAYGRLDLVFANAGINGVWAPIDELEPAEWDRTINTNLRGTYLTLHYAVPHLKQAGNGAIVITASINGSRTFTSAGATAYSATKAGQVAMAQMLAVELGKHRIRVNVVCPGKIETEIDDNTQSRHTEEAEVRAEYPDGNIPLTGKDPGTADEVAELVLFLLSDRARHISGTPVWIDGAQSLLV